MANVATRSWIATECNRPRREAVWAFCGREESLVCINQERNRDN